MADQGVSGYPEPPAVGGEAATLLGSLERQRSTFAWKCADLDADGLSRRLPPSELSLGRLLKHLAYMEDLNFVHGLGRWWREAVARSRVVLRAALTRGGPEDTYGLGDGQVETVRRLLVDMIEEYARHTGQADLLREAVDGRVGEDPPGPAYPFELG